MSSCANKLFTCIFYLFLVVEVHLAVSHLPPQPVHLLAELQLVLPLVRGLVQLFGQVEILAVQLGVLLTQLSQLLLQIGDHLNQEVRRWVGLAGWSGWILSDEKQRASRRQLGATKLKYFMYKK